MPTVQALNRATLARQMLIERHEMSALDAVAALAGLNAQNAEPPYVTLWNRLTGFATDDLSQLLHDKKVVRSNLMRYTQHLVTVDDFQLLRPVVQPALDRIQKSAFGSRIRGVDHGELVEYGTKVLRGKTMTRPQLGRLLAERWPGTEPSALAWSFGYLTALVHPPPDGMWGRRGGHTHLALAEDWLGKPLPSTPDPAGLVLKYLAAFGPASVRDIHAWSGISKLGEVVEKLRPQLICFDGNPELFDLPDAPRPDPETPVPPRFLPDFDNLVLAHADRSRVMTREVQSQVCVGAAVAATLLIDGHVRAIWRIERSKTTATLIIEPFERVDLHAVEEEALGLLAFMAPELDHDIRLLG